MTLRLLVCAALGISAAGKAAFAQARSGTADITIAVPSSVDSAHVEARYVLTSSRLPLDLRVLTRACGTIENLRVERDGAALGVIQSRDGPWISYRDAIPPGDSMRLVVRYDVKPGGAGVIPLVHPAASLASVEVTVRFDDDAAGVIFPRMTRQAAVEWSARFVAVPSFVRVAGSRSGTCDTSLAGDNGGLVWRFGLLVGIMIAWVPLYLVWARRTADTERA